MQFSERLTCTVKEAEAYTGISRSQLYALMGSGKLEFTNPAGRGRFIVVASLIKLMSDGLPSARELLAGPLNVRGAA